VSVPRLLSSYALPPSLSDALAKAGFETQNDVVELAPSELAKELGLSPADAMRILKVLRGAELGAASVPSVGGSGSGSGASSSGSSASAAAAAAATSAAAGSASALELYRRQHTLKPIYTLCQQIDKMLGGGVCAPQVTEFCTSAATVTAVTAVTAAVAIAIH
jgi:RAD51-like protein 2